jgi:hypothetical protein
MLGCSRSGECYFRAIRLLLVPMPYNQLETTPGKAIIAGATQEARSWRIHSIIHHAHSRTRHARHTSNGIAWNVDLVAKGVGRRNAVTCASSVR